MNSSLRGMKVLILTVLLGVFLTACGSGDSNGNGGGSQDSGADLLTPFYGNYNVTFKGQVGAEYQPTGSLVDGTTTGIVTFLTGGTITLSASEPGVIAVPSGETIPGMVPENVIFGAAVMQNPIHVFMGTPEASQAGDFGIFSMLRLGLPSEPNQLFYSGCSGAGGPFSCVPMFFRRTTMSGDSVNLVYFTSQVSVNNNNITINGKLVDEHTAEAAAANLFGVPIESPILGSFNDQFMFEQGALFKITVSGNSISGWIKGTGISVAGLAPQTAIFEATFEGIKE